MSVLVLRLAAPLQSWGVASRFARRDTQQYPSKSGVLGLIAAAQGRRRTDPIEDALTDLAFGVRVDQQGTLVRDFQVAVSLDGRDQYPLSQRYYLADAVFTAVVQGDSDLLTGIREALLRPAFPLYLGRRSCPVTDSLVLGAVQELSLCEALRETPWQAAAWYRKRQPGAVHLPIYRDRLPDEPVEPLQERVRDVPVSFDPVRREYGWRTVISSHVDIVNPHARGSDHDPMAALGGA
ncbi:type I-E CRISPR-associated protein Cas5/CasD [Nocardia terpenica]|uniref:Type I-E CRISPR-associated protein Cas5/CasD n=1 Tax=Nocardia terpenica TaxID=455432 RepID=A0A6G9Z008_9NOCA|nr:type I-E CRISPR-associated protein Cas5/CasD [Nocardia terpenica]QIS18915.1 type I-E CRISPR-associated protein Cas5/CasD [Nocardia terpenica]